MSAYWSTRTTFNEIEFGQDVISLLDFERTTRSRNTGSNLTVGKVRILRQNQASKPEQEQRETTPHAAGKTDLQVLAREITGLKRAPEDTKIVMTTGRTRAAAWPSGTKETIIREQGNTLHALKSHVQHQPHEERFTIILLKDGRTKFTKSCEQRTENFGERASATFSHGSARNLIVVDQTWSRPTMRDVDRRAKPRIAK